jgi:hypothetical protein
MGGTFIATFSLMTFSNCKFEDCSAGGGNGAGGFVLSYVCVFLFD